MSGRRRPYYAAYTDHMLNFYVRYKNYSEVHREIQQGKFRNAVDRTNWAACERLDQQLTQEERDVIAVFHGIRGDIQEAVASLAYHQGVDVQKIWDIEHSIQYRLAVIRGLVADDRATRTELA